MFSRACAGDVTRAALDAKEAENLVLVDRLFEEEEQRQAAFGLTAAAENLDATCHAEEAAADAIYAYPCRDMEEVRIKAEYLLAGPTLAAEMERKHIEALLQSFIGGSI